MQHGFKQRIRERARKHSTWLSIGLDPDPRLISSHSAPTTQQIRDFLFRVIDTTVEDACCYKLNSAFFEQLGLQGIELLKEVLHHIPEDIPGILDAKRGDIGNSSKAYASAAFESLGADAITLSPYMGSDSIFPFLKHHNKGSFLLALTSNPGANDLQLPNNLHIQVAKMANNLKSENENIGLVVGATHPQHIQEIRIEFPEGLLLVPGIGAQGGDLQSVIETGRGAKNVDLIFYASGSILYSKSPSTEATRLRDAINDYLLC